MGKTPDTIIENHRAKPQSSPSPSRSAHRGAFLCNTSETL